jgi:transcription elongation GreA/GreB family factor
MSRAFVKDQEENEPVEDLAERPISPNPNYVTHRGLRLMDAEITALRQHLAEAQRNEDRPAIARASRDLRYWVERRTTAQLIEPPSNADHVAFATRVTFEREDGKGATYAIVGEDESELKSGYIAYSVPLARAMMGKKVDDVADTPTGEIKITAIEPVKDL